MGATAGLSSSFISSGTQVAGSISQANAIKSQGAWESAQASTNARLAAMQADDATARGEQAAQDKAKQNAQMLGAQRAAAGGSGVAIDSGSAADIQKGTVEMGELDQLTIRNNASREALGYKVQSSNELNRARFTTQAANQAASNTILTGGMNALSNAGKGYSDYRRVNNGDLPGSNGYGGGRGNFSVGRGMGNN